MAFTQMWFGNVAHAQWVPHPSSGMIRGHEGYSEELAFANGGLWIERSAGSHAVYEMSFPVSDSSLYEGIEAFERFASGEWGTDYIRFVDPMQADVNLLTAQWASPGLIEAGWKGIHGGTPTFSDTSTNTYHKPPRKAVYAVTVTANAVPTTQNSVFTILIPPTYQLNFGASGTKTGDAVLRIQPINLDGTLASVADVTMTSDSAAPAFSNTFSGATYKAVRIYVTRTTSNASTITLTSMWAQVTLIGVAGTISRHIPGKGHSGLRFRGTGRAETYLLGRNHLTGASISFAEVEPWA